jgi:nicotinate-nucleotide pyrophosphorylase (carboxylating)
MLNLNPEQIRDAVIHALREDVGTGDVTALACIPAEARARTVMRAREPLVMVGSEFAITAFTQLSSDVRFSNAVADGTPLSPGQTALTIEGPARALLTAERTALNFVQHLSGIATATHRFVEAVHGTRARILDTRKTTPGWRLFEKYAVACGGGQNHRIGLWDMILIKDNHLAALASELPDPVTAAVRRARKLFPTLRVEVEADTLGQARLAAEAGADVILLDNMPPHQLRSAVQLIAGRSLTEASGGVRLDTVRAIAETGVDFISVGAITHSAPAVDLGLDFE